MKAEALRKKIQVIKKRFKDEHYTAAAIVSLNEALDMLDAFQDGLSDVEEARTLIYRAKGILMLRLPENEQNTAVEAQAKCICNSEED